MKLLVTGGAGFIGSAVIRHIIENTAYEVINLGKLSYAGNLESLAEVSESDAEDQQTDVQRLSTGLLAKYAAANNARLVHYSSDYVYPGTGESPWQETRPTGPLSCYGKTKLHGDQAIEGVMGDGI